MDLFGAFRILCAHRRGSFGLETVNPLLEAGLARYGWIPAPAPTSYAGRPVLITENDYALSLFNGDVGLVVGGSDEQEGLRACFLESDGASRVFSLARLPPHETCYAMTIHKSQGSEFDEVCILLPARTSPILSRELLYTAVTRARRRVTIFAVPEVLRETVDRRIERASGLREVLWTQSPSGASSP